MLDPLKPSCDVLDRFCWHYAPEAKKEWEENTEKFYGIKPILIECRLLPDLAHIVMEYQFAGISSRIFIDTSIPRPIRESLAVLQIQHFTHCNMPDVRSHLWIKDFSNYVARRMIHAVPLGRALIRTDEETEIENRPPVENHLECINRTILHVFSYTNYQEPVIQFAVTLDPDGLKSTRWERFKRGSVKPITSLLTLLFFIIVVGIAILTVFTVYKTQKRLELWQPSYSINKYILFIIKKICLIMNIVICCWHGVCFADLLTRPLRAAVSYLFKIGEVWKEDEWIEQVDRIFEAHLRSERL